MRKDNVEEKKVYIIILNYKGYKDTTACIKSLRKIDYNNYKIVVVDNSSNDGSFEKIKKENRDCVVLLSTSNNGFSAGNNIGIRYALNNGADYVMLLNNDTEVHPMFLKEMIKSANENTVVTPSIYYFSNPTEIWYASGKINYNRCTVENGDDKKSQYCSYASGCCLLIPKKVIERIGYWAEEYFMYYEDMDYSLRIINNGFKIFYNKNAKVYHKVGRTAGIRSKLSIYYNVRNRLYIIKKFKFRKLCWMFTIVSRCIRYAEGCLKNSNEKITLQAIKDFYSGKMGMREF